uniref:Peripheral subunit-binding (PSBD) domain-containing protein n=1 Tax=Ascaris lumbricoides TaxID=6252 RepID=A0A0M3HQR7_ASCLU
MATAAFLPAARQLRCLSTTSGKTHSIQGPAVRALLRHYGINQTAIKASGPKNNIIKTDVLKYIHAGNLKPIMPYHTTPTQRYPPRASNQQTATAAPTVASGAPQLILFRYTDIPLSNIRAVIARRLSESKKSIPLAYAVQKVDSDNVNELRKKLKNEGINVSVNDFIIKGCACALRAVPEVNVKWDNGRLFLLPTIDISVAVATPTGLITPIVFKADSLGVGQIGAKVRELAKKARENKLKLSEFQGGTFTVSNLGMYGSISHFTAIINPPQAAIMAVGGGIDELDTNLSSINRFQVTLCYDRRAVAEANAHRFLEHFALMFKEPDMMITGTKKSTEISLLL